MRPTVYVGQSDVDPGSVTLTDIEADWLGLGTTGAGGGDHYFFVPVH